MPYEVKKSESLCSASKPWAVVKKGTDKVLGCHETKEQAQKQQSALYANEEASAAQAAVHQFLHSRGIRRLPVRGASTPAIEISLTTVKDVALFEIGMDWPAATGPITFGPADIVSCSSQKDDPVLPRPRVKLGHTDPRYNNATVYDGTPNFGFVEITGPSEDGMSCMGNLVDVPVWLATVMPVAWPSRSVEGWQNFESRAGKTYPFCMTALSLLGVIWPGVTALEDLPTMMSKMYGKTRPDFVEIREVA